MIADTGNNYRVPISALHLARGRFGMLYATSIQGNSYAKCANNCTPVVWGVPAAKLHKDLTVKHNI